VLDYTDLNGLKKIVTDLQKIQDDDVQDIRYIKEEELDGVITLLNAIINTKEFNQKIR
jgi:ribosomal protein S18